MNHPGEISPVRAVYYLIYNGAPNPDLVSPLGITLSTEVAEPTLCPYEAACYKSCFQVLGDTFTQQFQTTSLVIQAEADVSFGATAMSSSALPSSSGREVTKDPTPAPTPGASPETSSSTPVPFEDANKDPDALSNPGHKKAFQVLTIVPNENDADGGTDQDGNSSGDDSDESPIPVWVWVGISFGGVVALVTIVFIVVNVTKRCMTQKKVSKKFEGQQPLLDGNDRANAKMAGSLLSQASRSRNRAPSHRAPVSFHPEQQGYVTINNGIYEPEASSSPLTPNPMFKRSMGKKRPISAVNLGDTYIGFS